MTRKRWKSRNFLALAVAVASSTLVLASLEGGSASAISPPGCIQTSCATNGMSPTASPAATSATPAPSDTSTPAPTDTASQALPTDPGPKPGGSDTSTPAPTATEPTTSPVATLTGPATVSGVFTNAAGAPLAGLTVTVSDTDALTDTASDVQLPVVGTTTTGADGSWSLALPDPLPSNLQAYADANDGVLNLQASANGVTSNGLVETATNFLSAGVAYGSATTPDSSDVRSDSSPTTVPLYVDTDTTPLDAPTDSSTDTDSTSTQQAVSTDSINNDTDTPWQNSDGTSAAGYNPDLVNGVDYSSVVPEDNPCTTTSTTLKTAIAYTTVGEAHAYWDATASFDYTSTMSSKVGVAISANGTGWSLSGSVSETGSAGHSTGFSGRGPYFGYQWRVPIEYAYVRNKDSCLHGGTSYDYEIVPRGYKVPAGGYTGVYGSNVSSWDGINHYDASNSKWRAIVADGSYFGISSGTSLTYTAGVNIFGLNLTSDTMYNNTHTQKITAGDADGQHDIWGAKGPIYGNPGTFYSW